VKKARSHKEETLKNIKLRLPTFVQADIYASLEATVAPTPTSTLDWWNSLLSVPRSLE
jgi:hypothetical protein